MGINVQLMVFNPVGERGEGEEIVLVNPRVTGNSKKMVLFNEGCLSFPGIYADVRVCINADTIFKCLFPWPSKVGCRLLSFKCLLSWPLGWIVTFRYSWDPPVEHKSLLLNETMCCKN